MKKIILLSILSCGVYVLNAQSLEQGLQQTYYEQFNKAENTLHEVLKQDENNAAAWYALSKTYVLQDEIQKAKDSILQAPGEVQSDPYFKVGYGSILLNQNKKQDAAEFFNGALKATKEKNVDIMLAVAESHINSDYGDANYAIEILNKAIKRDRNNAALYVRLGDAYRKTGNATEAYKSYKKALEENDKYAEAYHKIGDIFLSQKNPDLYVDYFKKAIAADPHYTPSLYKLYVYEFYHDPAKAMEYYKDYASKTEYSIQQEYDMADLYYLNKQYPLAIEKANSIIKTEGEKVEPRLFKLIGFSHAENKDTSAAIGFMEKYFANEADTNLISKDYVTMGEFYSSVGNDSLVSVYYTKGLTLEKDSAIVYKLYKKLADIAKEKKDYAAQAEWLGKYYMGNREANNVDLFYWGVAHYTSENYIAADSVFGMYVNKFPDQSFGYYWQAKSKARQDTAMMEGLAIPVYLQLVSMLEKDTANETNRDWLVEAYGYLGSYEAINQKDYKEAVEYFQKLLAVDPENAAAKKYVVKLEEYADKNKNRIDN